MAFGRTRIVVHEALDLAPATWILKPYRRAIKTGRSFEVGVTTCSQRPVGLHNDVLAEAEHVLVFHLKLEGDRAKIAGLAGPEALVPIPHRPGEDPTRPPHGFLYAGPATGGQAIACPPLRLPTGSRPPAAEQPGGTATWSGPRSATSSPSR